MLSVICDVPYGCRFDRELFSFEQNCCPGEYKKSCGLLLRFVFREWELIARGVSREGGTSRMSIRHASKKTLRATAGDDRSRDARRSVRFNNPLSISSPSTCKQSESLRFPKTALRK